MDKANELDEPTSEFSSEFDEPSESNKSDCLYQLYSKNEQRTKDKQENRSLY